MGEYKPIESYGIIGNLETCALVGRDGSIDWCCFPYLESSSVFAALLDDDRGGRFAVRPADQYESEQQYMDRTNVLQTTFHTDSGETTITDFMPLSSQDYAADEPSERAIYRQVTCTDGSVDLNVEFEPQFDYARAQTTIETVEDGVRATGDDERVYLSTSQPVEFHVTDTNGSNGAGNSGRESESETERGSPPIVRTTVSLDTYETLWFVVQYETRAPARHAACEQFLSETVDYWRDWVHDCDESECIVHETDHDMVIRSALALKLLTHRDTGAIAAAATTSLPEDIGGMRNWDYRFSWIRDAAFTIRAFSALGHTKEATDYLNRYLHLSQSFHPSDIRPLYALEHEDISDEETLDHLEGYKNSQPVRIGNEAASQLQLDMYGELVLGIYQLVWADEEVASEDWTAVHNIVEYVCEHWDKPDAGIWEVRGGPKHFVYSKVMCWTALDRAIELAQREDFDAPFDRWRDHQEEIEESILNRGFNEEVGGFTQSFDDDTLDATGLLVPLLGFVSFDDERAQRTIDAVLDNLTTDEGLVHRYEGSGDDLPGEEGAFVLCSFWLVDALAKSGRISEARDVFDSVIEYASPLGLLSEEVDPETGEQLGNVPQAFSHIGLINSALYLHEAETGETIEPFGFGAH